MFLTKQQVAEFPTPDEWYNAKWDNEDLRGTVASADLAEQMGDVDYDFTQTIEEDTMNAECVRVVGEFTVHPTDLTYPVYYLRFEDLGLEFVLGRMFSGKWNFTIISEREVPDNFFSLLNRNGYVHPDYLPGFPEWAHGRSYSVNPKLFTSHVEENWQLATILYLVGQGLKKIQPDGQKAGIEVLLNV